MARLLFFLSVFICVHRWFTNTMPEKSAYTRRQFLQSGLAMVSTIATVPAFLSSSANVLAAETAMRLSSKPGVPDDHVLVVVQLSGGNDGLNTVVPYGASQYYRARPHIAVPDKAVLSLDDHHGIGLHPALRELHDMVGEGWASVIQGVGYPNPNRSHFASMDVWHTGDTNPTGAARGRGWIGKALDANLAKQKANQKQNANVNQQHSEDAGLACISLGSEAPLATQGKIVKPVTFDNPGMFRWSARDTDPALSKAYDSLHEGQAPGQPRRSDELHLPHRLRCTGRLRPRPRKAVAQNSKTAFPRQWGLARQLEMVAAMIRAELPTRVYYVALGGFDTHASQPGRHERILKEFSQSMHAFYRELKATGHGQRVVSMAFSEFGRRVAQNASQGTDHGTAGPLFMFGQAPKSGLLGTHPSLDKLDKGDLIYTTDFRSVYRDILDDWMKMESAAVLGRRFPTAEIMRA